MEYKQLGVTDLQVSRICFGTFAFGGMWGGLDEAAAIDGLDQVVIEAGFVRPPAVVFLSPAGQRHESHMLKLR